MQSGYFAALLREIRAFSEKRESKLTADTVYIGGGTPSCVETKHISDLLREIFLSFNIANDAEITIECNPGTVTAKSLSEFRRAGINRLSVGLQSTDDKMLSYLGRIHTLRDFGECLRLARSAGFDNISADLMYGLPDQTLGHWKKTLETAAAFDTEHLSCYSLKIEEGTPFFAHGVTPPDDDTVADMYEYCTEFLKAHGYDRYEISNFAKHGFESRHNLKYWHCDDFIGFGAGAYSCMENSRFSNIRGINDYISAIAASSSAVCDSVPLSDFDKISEFVFLGLRCRDGISVSEFSARFHCDIFGIYAEPIEKYSKLGFLVFRDGRLRLSDEAFFVSNAILADFV